MRRIKHKKQEKKFHRSLRAKENTTITIINNEGLNLTAMRTIAYHDRDDTANHKTQDTIHKKNAFHS